MRTQFGRRIVESDLCVLCGEQRAITKEHIPPKGLFDVLPKDYLLVPSCETCNNSTKLDDEYFQQVLTGGSLVGEGVEIWKKKVEPKFQSFPGKRLGLRKQVGIIRVMINKSEDTYLPALYIEKNRFLRNIKKLVWGLYWFHTGNILAKATQLNVDMINSMVMSNYFDNPKNFEYFKQTSTGIYRDKETVKTFFYTFAISKKLSLWYFFFYKQNVFVAYTLNE